MTAEAERETILVSGFPAFCAKEMISLLAAPRGDAVLILARRRFARLASEFAKTLGEHVEVAEGDVCDMDLGLSGQEFSDLSSRVTTNPPSRGNLLSRCRQADDRASQR